jgi:PIN domain nuclease of toxin-antitoxin system
VILLDTQVVVWLNLLPRRISRVAAAAIRRAQRSDGLSISAVTLVELARLLAANRIEQSGTREEAVARLVEDMHIKPITVEIAALTTYFPVDFPSDPADRIIVATARAEGLSLVTADERIRKCQLLKTIW